MFDLEKFATCGSLIEGTRFRILMVTDVEMVTMRSARFQIDMLSSARDSFQRLGSWNDKI